MSKLTLFQLNFCFGFTSLWISIIARLVHDAKTGFSFVHFFGGWLWQKPPVDWVIFSKLLELFWNLEFFKNYLPEIETFHSKFLTLLIFTIDTMSISAILGPLLSKNPKICLFLKSFSGRIKQKTSGTLSFFTVNSLSYFENTLSYFRSWVIFALSYFVSAQKKSLQ